MGPVQGAKRRRVEKKVVVGDGVNPSSEQEPVDWWGSFSKRIAGPLSLSNELDQLESVCKVSRKTFNYIWSLVKDDLMAKPRSFTWTNGKLMSVNDQVAVALRRLSSGDSLLVIGESFGINHSTVSQVTWRFVEAMEERGLHHLQWPDGEHDMQEIKEKFEKIHGLPNCCRC